MYRIAKVRHATFRITRARCFKSLRLYVNVLPHFTRTGSVLLHFSRSSPPQNSRSAQDFPVNPDTLLHHKASSCAFKLLAMDGITYAKTTQTVYLKTKPPPPFSERTRHWTVSSVTGGLPKIDMEHLRENSAYLKPLFHHLYRRHVMTILLLVWTFALCYRFRRAHSRITRLKPHGYGLFVLLMLSFGYLDQFKVGIAVVATTTALCGKPFDALALLAVLILAQVGWTITAIGMTAAYATWARNSLNIKLVPSFERLLARLRPSPPAPRVTEEGEDRGCLVCWSSEDPPLQLPCHRDHKVCKSCLRRLYDADKYRCPLCRKALFVYRSRLFRVLIRYLIVAGTVIQFTLRTIVLGLQLYKGHYYHAAWFVFVSMFCVPLAYFSLRTLTEEWNLANTHKLLLWFALASTAYNLWSAAAAVQEWDQVTLWDGAVLEGVEVWDTHAVVKEHYAAAA
jgi:hypothetical protein